MQFDAALRERQIQPFTFRLAQQISLCLAEFFKHHGLLIGRDSNAVVDHRNLYCAAAGFFSRCCQAGGSSAK